MKYLSVFIVTLLLGVIPLQAQSLEALMTRGDSLHEARQSDAALKTFQEAEKLAPGNAQVLWRIAREYYDKGNVADEEKKENLYENSLTYARKAVEADPQSADAHLWVAIAAGKVALQRGGKEKVEMSREVKEEAMRAVELDPNNDSAYHVLARWHFEVATLSWVLKTAAKVVYGGMPEASLEESVRYFQKAVEISPDWINHRLQLAKVYIEQGNEEKARTQLRKVLELPEDDVEDPQHKEEARELLAEL